MNLSTDGAHRARKRFGQHFLHDQQVIEDILAALGARAGEIIVEIGPGLGALTEGLVQSGAELHLVEIDRDLAARWRERGAGKLQLHEADALKFDFSVLKRDEQRLRLIGNLPYNISTPLLFHLLQQIDAIADMYFMLQKEVVDRLAAAPGGADWGRLSVMVQYRCAVQPLFEVPPEAFRPPPRVDSAVVRLLPRSFPGEQAHSVKVLETVVRSAFGQRRKTLRNALRGLVEPALLSVLGIDANRRPETLSIDEFVAIANTVHAARKAD